VDIRIGMFFRHFLTCSPKLFSSVVLLHIDAEVCPLSISARSSNPRCHESAASSHPERVEMFHRHRSIDSHTSRPVTTSTRIPILSP
jgi:hypothetical protein